MATMKLIGLLNDDPIWMYSTGWGIVVACLVLIVLVAFVQIYSQVDYNWRQKFTTTLKPSRKWGPVDTIFRYGWVKWRSKTEEGARDFTLKRRGTRDYTHSVKNRRAPIGTSYNSTLSNGNTLPRPSPYAADQNETDITINGRKVYSSPLEVTSIIDTLDRPRKNNVNDFPYYNRTVINPLAQPDYEPIEPGPLSTTNSSAHYDTPSEGYGTIRNGPYVINGNFTDHVCWRRRESYEDATEL